MRKETRGDSARRECIMLWLEEDGEEQRSKGCELDFSVNIELAVGSY